MGSKHSIKAACSKDTVYCKVEGMGSMKNSSPFRDFTESLFEKGCKKFVIDLQNCCGMDSTFMGTILGIALLKGRNDSKPQVLVVNCSDENHKLLDGLGVTQLIKVSREEVQFPKVELAEIQEDTTMENQIQTIYQAHKNLIDVDKRNAEKFGKFLKSLLKELS